MDIFELSRFLPLEGVLPCQFYRTMGLKLCKAVYGIFCINKTYLIFFLVCIWHLGFSLYTFICPYEHFIIKLHRLWDTLKRHKMFVKFYKTNLTLGVKAFRLFPWELCWEVSWALFPPVNWCIYTTKARGQQASKTPGRVAGLIIALNSFSVIYTHPDWA